MLTVSLGEGPQTHAGVLLDLATAQAGDVLVHTGGWTVLTAVNLMLFTLLHHPCSTTVLTIWKETGSPRWTVVATVLPLALGLLVTVGTTAVARLVGS